MAGIGAVKDEGMRHGRAAPGVQVSVEAMGHTHPDPEGDDPDENIEGPYFPGGKDTSPPPVWPKAVTTDGEGRFSVRGVGRGLRVLLMIDDPRFARQRLKVNTDSSPGRGCDLSNLRYQRRRPALRKEFTVTPGETLDLGDVVIEKPEE